MFDLSQQRCFNHLTREAAARCPECGRFFCRECVTEHSGRLMCTPCLHQAAQGPLLRRRGLAGVLRAAQLLTGIFVLWFFFYCLGQALLSIPATYHEGEVWTRDHQEP
jgi:hypothetical protein